MRTSASNWLLLFLLPIGCGGGDEREALEGSRGDDAVRELCTEGRAETIDVDGDGDVDIRHMYDGAQKRCSEYDLNNDGSADSTRFFAPDGVTPLREEGDYDFDGRIDQIAYYENGVLVRKELDTNFDNRIDAWYYCQGSSITRTERDRGHTGRPDTWETYENGRLAEASYDENNDGRPDKWEIFQRGVLVEVRNDTDRDGRPDRQEAVPESAAGPPDEPLTCDGSPPQAPPEPEPSSSSDGTSGGETPATEDAGTDAASDFDDVQTTTSDAGVPAADGGRDQ